MFKLKPSFLCGVQKRVSHLFCVTNSLRNSPLKRDVYVFPLFGEYKDSSINARNRHSSVTPEKEFARSCC
jgi:hypothetical protein